jgi:hypothetical protein
MDFLYAPSVCSVSLWWNLTQQLTRPVKTQRHRGNTEISNWVTTE